MDEFSKDERNLSCGYEYSEINTHAWKKNVFVKAVGRKQVMETPKLSNGRKILLFILSVHHLI